MIYNEVQLKMGEIFEQLQTLEVKKQELDKALKELIDKEKACKEGLDSASIQLNKCKDEQIVSLEIYLLLVKNKIIVSNYYNQTKSLRLVTEQNLKRIKQLTEKLQKDYDNFSVKLLKLEKNIISPKQWQKT